MLLAILILRQKNAQIMLDSQNNATLVPENALFYFKQLLLYIYILFVYF